MRNISLNKTKQWLKHSDTPLAKTLFAQIKTIRRLEMPAPRLAVTPLYFIYCFLRTLVTTLTRILWWTPLLKGRCESVGRNLHLFGGLPFISGSLKISMGDDCRVSGHTTFSGRTCAQQTPELRIGNNVDIGYMTTIAVGQQVKIGNNVRIAGHAFLAGYPGHPLDAKARAAGQPETDNQVGNIILEEDVWLATNVSVLASVRIGRGTIVATGSVVTHDLPAMVLAAGIPARVIRHLDNPVNEKNQ